jgi:hypothetical protein
MAIESMQFVTIKCDNAPECDKSLTYEAKTEQEVFANPANVWIQGLRRILTSDNRMKAYCSDACEIKGVATGEHNRPLPKKIIDGIATAQHVAAAVQAAKLAEAATAALKAGPPKLD